MQFDKKKFTFSSDSNYEKLKKKKGKYGKKSGSESNKNDLNSTNTTLGKNIKILN